MPEVTCTDSFFFAEVFHFHPSSQFPYVLLDFVPFFFFLEDPSHLNIIRIYFKSSIGLMVS